MSIGEKLLELRKSKHLSQEQVAEQLNVSRQTVSKWETDQSMPDFDKIVPLCELYQISADELLMDKKSNKEVTVIDQRDYRYESNRRKKAIGISLSVFGYFLSIIWIMVTIPVFHFDPILASAGFLLICGISTFIVVYTCIVYKRGGAERIEKVDNRSKLEKLIDNILVLVTLFIYLILSFGTMAWHITWILWVVYRLLLEIVKLFFLLRGMNYEE